MQSIFFIPQLFINISNNDSPNIVLFNFTIGQFLMIIRMILLPKKAIFIFINIKKYNFSQLINSIYDKDRRDDNFYMLHIPLRIHLVNIKKLLVCFLFIKKCLYVFDL